MPRLKPPPGQQQENDVLEKGLEIELSADPIEDHEELAGDTEEQKLAKREAAREYRANKKKEDEAREEENKTLKQQLADLQTAMDDSRKHAEEARRRQAEIEQRARENEARSTQYLSRAEEAEYQAVLVAISAAENEAEGAQRDLVNAQTNGDFQAASEAQRRLSRAEAKYVQLEENKDHLERRKAVAQERAEEARRNPPAPQNLSPEQQIDAVNALLPSQKEWLKKHLDAWTDQRKNMRLQGAHVEAEDQGLTPGTAKYFDYLETRLGYKKAAAAEEDEVEEEEERPQRRKLVQAPVSREGTAPSGKSSRTKITLTPKQLEAASIAGIAPEVYAKHLMKLQDMKEEGYYNE